MPVPALIFSVHRISTTRMNGILGRQGKYGRIIVEQKQGERKLDELFAKHDVDNTVSLGPCELRSLLRDVSLEKTGRPTEPTDDDISFILKTCDKDGTSSIERSELKFAISAWDLYLDTKQHADSIFDKYDRNRSGRLERAQLRAYLLDILALEGEYGISEADVDFVLKVADETKDGSINKMELHKATACFVAARTKENDASCCIS